MPTIASVVPQSRMSSKRMGNAVRRAESSHRRVESPAWLAGDLGDEKTPKSRKEEYSA